MNFLVLIGYKMLEVAAYYAESALTIWPRNILCMRFLVNILMNKKVNDFYYAKVVCENALEVDPDSEWARITLKKIHQMSRGRNFDFIQREDEKKIPEDEFKVCQKSDLILCRVCFVLSH